MSLQSYYSCEIPLSTLSLVSYFYFFSPGAAQNFARKYAIPIDHIGFEFQVIDAGKHIDKKPENGVYVRVYF